MGVPEKLHGGRVVLRPAASEDVGPICEWLARSDLTATMAGSPTYPERAVPSWDEFLADYPGHYFDDSSPELGRCLVILVDDEPVGQVNHNDVFEQQGRRRVELDIWMRSEACCGKGYGTDALDVLCRHLHERFGVVEFLVQPSARNPRAIRAYEKAGFVKLDVPGDAVRELWGPADYSDSVYMVRTMLPDSGRSP
jgi:diamine N-acetyltransferase